MIGEVHLIVCSLFSQLSDYKHHFVYSLSFMFVFLFPFWFFLFLYVFSFFPVLQLIKCVLDDDLQEEKRNGVPKSVHSVPGLFNFFILVSVEVMVFVSCLLSLFCFPGIRSDSSMPTPLPDRRMLEFILHKLQKCVIRSLILVSILSRGGLTDCTWFFALCGRKDTYGVYAEPVDPKEVF